MPRSIASPAIAGLLLLLPAPAHAASIAQAPAGCTAFGSLIDRSGTRSGVSVADGAATRQAPVPGDTWSFMPVAVLTLGSAGGPGGGFTNEIAVRQDGAVFSFRREFRGDSPGGATDATASERRLGATWERTRAVAGGYQAIYRLDGDTLRRHRFRPGGGGHFAVGDGVAIRGGDFGRLRTLATQQADRSGRTVLYATTSRGALRRLVIDGQRVVADTRLRASGFRGVDALRLGFCETGDGRPLLTRTRAGELRLFLDPRPDADGSDITGGAVVATGVGGRLY